MNKKRGQFEMSFGMIFSVFLIVIFIVVAFIAIKSFLSISCTTETGQFVIDLQKNIDEKWSGAGTDNFVFRRQVSGNCKLDYVCFYDSTQDAVGVNNQFFIDLKPKADKSGELHNFYFYPPQKFKIPSTYLKHINLDSFNEKQNPYCIKPVNGVIEIKLSKGIKEDLVRIG